MRAAKKGNEYCKNIHRIPWLRYWIRSCYWINCFAGQRFFYRCCGISPVCARMPCYRIRYLLCYLANAKKSDYYCPTRGRRKNFVLVGYMATKKIILLLFPPINKTPTPEENQSRRRCRKGRFSPCLLNHWSPCIPSGSTLMPAVIITQGQ